MAHSNEDLGEPEKDVVGTTPQETDDVAVVNKEIMSSHEGHGSETTSGAASQTVAAPDTDPTSEPPSEAPIEQIGRAQV